MRCNLSAHHNSVQQTRFDTCHAIRFRIFNPTSPFPTPAVSHAGHTHLDVYSFIRCVTICSAWAHSMAHSSIACGPTSACILWFIADAHMSCASNLGSFLACRDAGYACTNRHGNVPRLLNACSTLRVKSASVWDWRRIARVPTALPHVSCTWCAQGIPGLMMSSARSNDTITCSCLCDHPCGPPCGLRTRASAKIIAH